MNASERVPEFVELLTQSARRIYSYIRTLVPNQTDAEDVFQETSKVLWEKFDEYEPGTDFCAWAISIAHFKALQARRIAGGSRLVLEGRVESLLMSAAVFADARCDDRFRALADCFQKLPDLDQQLIDTRYQQGASTRAIAEQQGRSIDFVYRSLRRVHKALFDCIRAKLDEEERS